jgi:hypothetical protein
MLEPLRKMLSANMPPDSSPWPRLLRVRACGWEPWQPQSNAVFSSLLRAVGPQLTDLYIPNVTLDMVPLVQRCAKLRSLTVASSSGGTALSRKLSPVLCDALIASGAPLVNVDAAFTKPDAVRLLKATPTLTHASSLKLRIVEIPRVIADRMHYFDGQRLPG